MTAGGTRTPDGVTEDVPCTDADEFLTELRPRNVKSWDGDSSLWIHRGQGDAAWELQAGAVRRPALFADYGVTRDASTWDGRSKALVELLAEFGQRLEAGGISTPIAPPRVDDPGHSVHVGGLPPHLTFPLMALAQHHGLPTPLLDWTRRAYVAAYFAITGIPDPPPSHLCVWSLFVRGIGRMNVDQPRQHDVLMYEAPASTNSNLRAQAGVFTVVVSLHDLAVEKVVAWQQQDDANRNSPMDPRRVDPPSTRVPLRLRRTTLPPSEGGRLLRLLANEGVDGASMFPGADGVARALKERQRWKT